MHRAYARATPDIPHSPSIVWPAARSQAHTTLDEPNENGPLDAPEDFKPNEVAGDDATTGVEVAEDDESEGNLPKPLEFIGAPANQGQAGNINSLWAGKFSKIVFNPSRW